MMIRITFPDSRIREYPTGTTGLEIAQSLSPQLAKEVMAISVNGEVMDLTRAISSDSSVRLHKWDDDEGKHAFWHSSAHLMAEAIENLFPGTKFGIGPAIESGFYYDVDLGEKVLSENELIDIEAKMIELAAKKSTFNREDISRKEALELFTRKGDEYKVELITDLADGTITLYRHGSFTDLCRGPHLPDTSPIKAIKVISLAGAYWRGDEKRKQLTRIYGISFPKKSMLD
jgi:threonyl-tRNA synthetase